MRSEPADLFGSSEIFALMMAAILAAVVILYLVGSVVGPQSRAEPSADPAPLAAPQTGAIPLPRPERPVEIGPATV